MVPQIGHVAVSGKRATNPIKHQAELVIFLGQAVPMFRGQ